MQSYQETLNYMFDRLPMFSRLGSAAYNKNLDNTIALCTYFKNPQNSFKSIHVAGTNGKGSVSHMLAAILQESGYKTGLYTSPHLKDFRERIKVNGEMIPEEYVTSFIQKVQNNIERINPSFFELTVAMAFVFFEEMKVDIAVIETGMGGRIDSTNVITPQVSVITNIGWDHTQFLGDTLEQIAAEKAGIIKSGIPVVIGETNESTAGVFIEKAKEMQSPLYFADQLRKAEIWDQYPNRLNVSVRTGDEVRLQDYQLDLTGLYQTKNLLTVLESVKQLQKRGFSITDDHISRGLNAVKKHTGLHGRWELIHEQPSVILDVAHNEDGIRQVINQLKFCRFNRLHIVFGMVKDKDADKVLSLLPKDAIYYLTKAQIPRALDETELYTRALQNGLTGDHYPTVMDAVRSAVTKAQKDDLVLVCGSVFIVGEVNASEIGHPNDNLTDAASHS